MRLSAHRRRILPFLLAVVLPSFLLIALALRGLAQERELVEKRRRDQQVRSARLLAGELGLRLDRLAQLALDSSAHDSVRWRNGIMYVAQVRDGRLLWTWDSAAEQRVILSAPERARAAVEVAQAERRELIARNPRAAAFLYRDILRRSSDASVVGAVRLRLARALHDAGDFRGSELEAVAALNTSFEATDLAGVPLALYAATRLVGVANRRSDVATRLEEFRRSWEQFPPAALYISRQLADSLALHGATDLAPRIAELALALRQRLGLVERLLALQAEFDLPAPVPDTGSHPGSASWMAFGADPLLVGPIPRLPNETTRSFPVVVVAVESLLTTLASEGLPADDMVLSLAGASRDSAWFPLGPRLGGLGVTFARPPGGASSPLQVFYLAGVALVVLLAVGGAWLLWRDVRREVQLAGLRSQFVAGVSHELKTPLTSIRLFAETLSRGSVTEESERREYLQTIVAESERLSRLLSNVLDFGQIERGEKRYVMQRESLPAIVRDTVRSVQHSLRTHGFRLEVSIDDDLPQVTVDRDAIEQALLNLLSNAMKYSCEARDIELRVRRRDGAALVEVVDRGIGIPVSEQERIFERYYRVAPPGAPAVPGSGLGLALVRHVANAHGGAVTVESAPDQGSTFTLRLPLADNP